MNFKTVLRKAFVTLRRPLHLERVDARTIKKLRCGTLKLRQKPGPENATGLIKFEFPNREDVYLHGTPQTKLFAKTARDLSHGCVRVDDPVSLAVRVLRNQQGWDVNRVNAEIGDEKTDRVNVDMPVPVLIIYATAAAGDDGAMYFFPDVYGYDADFKRVLAYGYPHLQEAKPTEDLGQEEIIGEASFLKHAGLFLRNGSSGNAIWCK